MNILKMSATEQLLYGPMVEKVLDSHYLNTMSKRICVYIHMYMHI